VTSSVAVFEAAIRVKSMCMIKSLLEIRKKIENMEIKEICYIDFHLRDGLGMKFTAC